MVFSYLPLSFEHPEIILLIVPLIIVALYLFYRGTSTRILESRVIIISLLILALASPYIMFSETKTDVDPNLVVISDETSSMQLFEEGVGNTIYESMASKTPTTLVQMSGEKTNLGDAIIQNSGGDNQIVLVTDGNNNYGESLEEALEFAENTGTKVYAIQPELETNDLSVQIEGDKTAVKGNENFYQVVIKQAQNREISYELNVYIDGELNENISGTYGQNERLKKVIGSYRFQENGKHTIRVTINPHSSDYDHINNEFYKSIYVIPKPDIQLLTDNPYSPISEDVLRNLYNVTYSNDISNIKNKKTVIVDNQHISTFSGGDIQKLQKYVTDGHGLVVIGGDRSYNHGNYLNSSLETLLPVTSEPTDWTGGKNIVFLIDTSESSGTSDPVGGGELTREEKYNQGLSPDRDYSTNPPPENPMLPKIKGSAINIITNEDLRDAYAGIIAFGSESQLISEGLIPLGLESNRNDLEEKIRNLSAKGGTSLDKGLEQANELLKSKGGQKVVIIISDGKIEPEKSVNIAREMKKENINFYFINIVQHENNNSGEVAKQFMESIETDIEDKYFLTTSTVSGDITFTDETGEPPENQKNDSAPYPVIEYNSNHFITRDINTSGNVTGYNDVTPKAGAERLVITSSGKPIVTTWRYGLGRVTSLTTDNGNQWASPMYNATPKILSRMVNWAIGNPRAEEGIVLEAPDGWSGTQIKLELTRYDEGGLPSLQLDDRDEPIELSVTGENTYESTTTIDRIGMHDISGYPVAVNYALEYRDVGFNENLPSLIKSHGGKMYTEGEARALLLDDARESATKTVQTPFDLKMYFILAALSLFLLEIIVRRVREIQEYKNTENE